MKIKEFMMKIKGFKFTKKRVLIALSIFLIIAIGSAAGLYLYVRNTIFTNPQDITVSNTGEGNLEDPGYQEVSGITNILLIGVDARDLNEKARSDSMMIATIDNNAKKVKLTSIMRDSYVDINGYKTQKINAAYALGGPELLMDTIQRNFKIKLDKYIVINFWGFEDIIDLVGGIDVEVKDYEISEINKYIGEVREQKSPPLTAPGMQHLDGQQALSYARIRKVGNGAYERDSRQREVIGILAQKLKETSVFQYGSLMKKILPYIKTNIEPINFLNYAYTVAKFKPLTMEGLQMPTNELSSGQMYMDTWVLLMDKEQNSKVLNDFIFNDKITDPKELDMKAFRTSINAYLSKEKALKPATKEPTEVNDEKVDSTPVKTPNKQETTSPSSTTGGTTTPSTGGTTAPSTGGTTAPSTGGTTTPSTGGTTTPSTGGTTTPSTGGTTTPSTGGTTTPSTGGTTTPSTGGTTTPSTGGTTTPSTGGTTTPSTGGTTTPSTGGTTTPSTGGTKQ